MAPTVSAVVVDNSSNDGTVEKVQTRKGVRLIENRTNRGFAGAANQAIQTTGDAGFILLLNPDARILTGVDRLVEASRTYGLAAGKLVDAQGAVQTGFTVRRFPTAATLICESLGINRMWPSNPVNRRYRYLDRDLNQAGTVDQPAGAFLMFRKDVWTKLGGFDERFHPVWFEDVDFCRRATEAGFGIFYDPSVSAEHDGGRSVGSMPSGSRAVVWCVSLLRYAFKHFTAREFRAVCAAVVLGSVPRMVAGMILDQSLKPAKSYSKVIWVSVRSFATAKEPNSLRAI